jgi:hypothetical protein
MIPLPQTLSVNKTRFIVMAAAGFLLAGVCFFWATTAEPGVKYGMAGFWLLCGLCGLVLMKPSMNSLQLDNDGMTVKSGIRSARRINFVDVAPEGFTVARFNKIDIVVWSYKPGARPESAWRSLNRSAAWEDNLPGTYGGHNPRAMCDLLNALHAQKASSP